MRGAEFFEWTERLHRFLLLPREDGKSVTGTLAACLMVLALSGLYLRWPRRVLSWRAWLTFDPALKGRSFLWGLHSVAGTVALVLYLVSTSTGMYWAFDAVRSPVDSFFGAPPRNPRPATPPGAPRREPGAERPAAFVPNLAPAWATFAAHAQGRWTLAQVRLPERANQPVQFSWLDHDAVHERARNRLNVGQDGRVVLEEAYAALPAGKRFLGAIYPLHMGTFFGLPGRIVMFLSSLGLALFAITGWMLYLDRRCKKRAAGGDAVLVAWATQSGRAERLALATAALLRQGGAAATVQPLAGLDMEQLRHHGRVLFVASTFGEGDPPDGARRFARLLAQAPGAALPHLRYGLLALGDRHYAAFCGFGHTLDHGLRRLGAQPLFPLVEMDGEAPDAWTAWRAALQGHLGLSLGAEDAAAGMPMAAEAPFTGWRLAARTLCNPGSLGAPLYRITLEPPAGLALAWLPGALAEVLPRHAPATVAASLNELGRDGAAAVRWAGRDTTLAEAMAGSMLPLPGSIAAGISHQELADGLLPLAARSYSVASLPEDGQLQLLVRQERHEAGLGVSSGWLTAFAPLGTVVDLRLVANAGFAPVEGDAPAIFVGNGSGYAGLRGHLRARTRAGRARNWLVFGERQQAHDAFCADEAIGWRAAGLLERADLVYSRDQGEKLYVQDRLRAEAEAVRHWVDAGAVVYVCGSLDGMAAGVDAALDHILGSAALDDLIAEGRYRRDVY